MVNKKEQISEEDIERIELVKEAENVASDIEILENVMIQSHSVQIGFKTLMDSLESRDYIVPNFQRAYRWTEKQAEGLAVSLVKGFPIPPIYGYRNKEQQIVIIDGQQRLISLYLYYKGKFLKKKNNAFVDMRKLTDSNIRLEDYLEQYGLVNKKYNVYYKEGEESKKLDITYNKLSEILRRKIDYGCITLIEINVDSKESRERTLHKIFANLNMGGTPLSSQELRNGIYCCEFYNMLQDINENNLKWRTLYSGRNMDVNKESKDVELLLKLCAFKYYVTYSDNTYKVNNYKGKIGTLLDDFSEEALKFSKEQIEEYKKAILEFFDRIKSMPSNNNKDLVLLSLFVVLDKTNSDVQITKELCEEIVKYHGYSDTVKQGTSNKQEIEKRFKIVHEKVSGNGR